MKIEKKINVSPFIKDILNPSSWFYKQTTQGLYFLTPLGECIMDHAINVIKDNLNPIFDKVRLPILQNTSLIDESCRDQRIQDIIISTNAPSLHLVPTCEEAFENIWRNTYLNDKYLNCKNMALYQINYKFRKEPRYSSGLYRTMEFVMKDGYAFGTLDFVNECYKKIKDAYIAIFDQLKLTHTIEKSDSAEEMGNNSYSEEFKHNGKEIAEIFFLDKTYTRDTPYFSGSYGIGITRVVEFIIQNMIQKKETISIFDDIESPITIIDSYIGKTVLKIDSKNKKFIIGVAEILNIKNIKFRDV